MVDVKKKSKRTLVGEVVSDKMDKTVVVEVELTSVHKLLGKVTRSSKTYKVHDELGQAKVGDVVSIYEGRPVSKTKYMYLDKVVRSAANTK